MNRLCPFHHKAEKKNLNSPLSRLGQRLISAFRIFPNHSPSSTVIMMMSAISPTSPTLMSGQWFLNKGILPRPPGHIWSCLEAFLVFPTPWGGDWHWHLAGGPQRCWEALYSAQNGPQNKEFSGPMYQ